MDTIDTERLRILAKTKLLDHANEEAYDRFTRLAAMLLDTPVSLVSLIDRDRQHFKSYYGLPEPWASQPSVPLDHSFCQYVVAFRKPLIVKDAREDALLKYNLAIPDLGVIAYLGFPLIVEDQALGSFCVIDNKPRVWSEREIKIVQELAKFVTTEIALRVEMVERQKVTEQLQVSEERFRTLADRAPLTIWQADNAGITTFINATWCTFTGMSEQESLGEGWMRAVHPDDLASLQERWMQQLKAMQPVHNEFRVRRADGVYRAVVSDGSAYTGQQGTFSGYIGTMLDITEQKELEMRREEFMSITAHELKAPLTAIQGNVQLAQRRLKHLLRDIPTAKPEEQQATLSQVISTLTRGMEYFQIQTRLINELQDLSRIQAAKMKFTLSPCDLIELVRQTVQDYQITYTERTIVFDEPDAVSLRVLVDGQRIRQAVSNYLTNALKYSPPGQPIEVGITADATSARVWVRDHGIGLSPEQQAHIWERFYQTHETTAYTSAGTSGLGLGLPISQALIQGHQGKVGVESAKGEGSTFWFTLPLLPA
ncbi:MAG TPA: ATP-binding protein [Ktedonobacteraceae bacterium]